MAELKAFSFESEKPKQIAEEEEKEGKEKEQEDELDGDAEELLAQLLNSWQNAALGEPPKKLVSLIHAFPDAIRWSLAWSAQQQRVQDKMDL